MDTGQISLMPVNVGMPTPVGAQPPSLATLLSEPGEQAGGPFAGLLDVMTPPKTLQGGAAPVSVGNGVPASEKNGETASTTAVQDGVSGLMAGLLNALGAAGKPMATGTEQSAEAPVTANSSDKKPQDVAMNAAGMQPSPLLTQADGGRMPQAGDAVEQQTVHVADKPLASATKGSAEVPARADTLDKKPQDAAMNAAGMQPPPLLTQADGGRMPQAVDAVEQQTVHVADKPLASATKGSAEVPARADTLDKKPQDAAMNAAGMQPPPLLAQADGGRMPQAVDAVEQQTVHVADKPLASVTKGSAEVPARADTLDMKPQDAAMNAAGMQPPPLLTQADGGRMPQTGGAVEQQTVAASVADTAVTSLSNNGGFLGIGAATSAAAGGGLNPPESLLNPSRSAMAANGHLKGASADSTALEMVPKGNDPQQTSQKKPDGTAFSTLTLPSRQVSAVVEQQNPVVVSSTLSTERGTAPSNQNGSVSSAVAPVSGSPGPDEGGAEVRTTTSFGVEVTAQPQQQAPPFHSASLEAALAENSPRNEVRTTGQAQDVLSAQDTPVAEIPAASTAMTAQTEPQQVVSPANSGVMPVQVAPSPATSQQPDQAVTANNDTLEGTMPVQAVVVPAAGKMGVEAGGDAAQTRPESAATANPVQSITAEAVKFAGAGSSGEEFSTGDDKGTTDNFMNGQFHATLMHQQGNFNGASATSAVAAPVQNVAQQSGLPEQIMHQVNGTLVNHEVKAGNDQIVLRLSPENLGELKVNLSMDGQSLKVQIVAENHMVRDTLLQNIDSLKESLARQNIRMESFDVTTGGRGAGNPGQGQQQNDWHGSAQQKQQNAWMSSGGYRLPDTTTVANQLAYQTPSQHTMVDLHF